MLLCFFLLLNLICRTVVICCVDKQYWVGLGVQVPGDSKWGCCRLQSVPGGEVCDQHDERECAPQ